MRSSSVASSSIHRSTALSSSPSTPSGSRGFKGSKCRRSMLYENSCTAGGRASAGTSTSGFTFTACQTPLATRDGSWWAWVSWVHEAWPTRSQGGPGAGRQPAPAGATRGLQDSATPGAWPRRADRRGGLIATIASECADCCQHCCHGRGQLPTEDDRPGTSPQKAATPGQVWTVRP
jgi:hypothetical protein